MWGGGSAFLGVFSSRGRRGPAYGEIPRLGKDVID